MKRILPAILLIFLIAGCESDDRLMRMANEHQGRLAQLSKEHEARQAEQNLKMAELQKSVADSSKRLVEADAESREKFLAMQDNLRADQATIGQQRDKLEGERREIAAQRVRDPIVAEAIMQVGLVLACLLPLVLAGYLVYTMKHTASQDDAVVAELLIGELVSEHPMLLGPPPQPTLMLKPDDCEAEPS